MVKMKLNKKAFIITTIMFLSAILVNMNFSKVTNMIGISVFCYILWNAIYKVYSLSCERTKHLSIEILNTREPNKNNRYYPSDLFSPGPAKVAFNKLIKNKQK